MLKLHPSDVDAAFTFASFVEKCGTTLWSAISLKNGRKNVTTIVKLQTGLMQIPRNVPSARLLLRRMAAAITWFAKIRIVAMNFAGQEKKQKNLSTWSVVNINVLRRYVWDLGNHMAAVGITAIAMMKIQPGRQGTTKKDLDLHYNGIYFTAVVTWITCSLWNSRKSFTLWWKTKWRKCNSTTCLGSKYNSWKRQ